MADEHWNQRRQLALLLLCLEVCSLTPNSLRLKQQRGRWDLGQGPCLPAGSASLRGGTGGGFPLPKDAVTLGGLLSQAVVDKRCVPPSPTSSLDGATREPEVAVAGGSHES